MEFVTNVTKPRRQSFEFTLEINEQRKCLPKFGSFFKELILILFKKNILFGPV